MADRSNSDNISLINSISVAGQGSESPTGVGIDLSTKLTESFGRLCSLIDWNALHSQARALSPMTVHSLSPALAYACGAHRTMPLEMKNSSYCVDPASSHNSSYAPIKAVAESAIPAVIPGGSLEAILSCQEPQSYAHSVNSPPITQGSSKYQRSLSLKAKAKTAKQYWVRGRRTLQETADFFKNLPTFTPSPDDASININSHQEDIVSKVMARPYASPFAKSPDEFLLSSHSVVESEHESLVFHGSSDDGIRSLLALVEESDAALNMDKEQASFDGLHCQVPSRQGVESNLNGEQPQVSINGETKSTDSYPSLDLSHNGYEEEEVAVQIVSSGTIHAKLAQRSAYAQSVSRTGTANKALNQALSKSKGQKSWGNNLYVSLCANNAPTEEHVSKIINKQVSASWFTALKDKASKNKAHWGLNELSEALSSLLGFKDMDSSTNYVLEHQAVGDFQKALQGHKRSTCTVAGQVIVSDTSNPLYLSTDIGTDINSSSPVANYSLVPHNNQPLSSEGSDENLAMDLEQTQAPVGSSTTLMANDNQEAPALEHPVIRAFAGKNDLNGQSNQVGLSRASEEERRLERRISSYFMPSDYVAKYLASNKREAQPADIMAFGMFKQWMRRRSALLRPDGTLEEGNEATLYEIVLLLVQTMIFAMRADGRIETNEHNSLIDFCFSVVPKQLYNNIRGEVDRLLTIDLDPELLAQKVRYPEENIDIYLLSAVLLNNSHFLELGYLESLAACLGIDPSLRRHLDDNARTIVLNRSQYLPSLN